MIQRKIPGWYRIQQGLLLSTALGVVIHEYAHKKMAEDFGLNVSEVVYFQMGDSKAGYVTHDTPRTYTGMVAVSIAPFILNTTVAYTAFILGGVYAFYQGPETLANWEWVMVASAVWVGFSAALHAFPSGQDIGNVWNAAKAIWSETTVPLLQPIVKRLKNHNIIFRILLLPVWIPILLVRGVIFSLRDYRILLSFPVLALLVLLNKFKAVGSHFAFAGLILLSSYYSISFVIPEVKFQIYNQADNLMPLFDYGSVWLTLTGVLPI